jgi:hypothetical protein
VRWTVANNRAALRKVLLDDVNNKKKMKYSVYTLQLRSLYLHELTKVGAPPGAVGEPAPEAVKEAPKEEQT